MKAKERLDIILTERNMFPSREKAKASIMAGLIYVDGQRVAVDIGASTGGFTDCMLKNGARKVFAIDVGYGQLDWRLRNDPRVVNMEKVNVRYLDPETIETPVDFISIDVSFISLKLVFPVAADLLGEDGSQVIETVITYGRENGLYSHGLTWSPVTGAKGNIEYLLYMKKQPPQEEISEDAIKALVADSHAELES